MGRAADGMQCVTLHHGYKLLIYFVNLRYSAPNLAYTVKTVNAIDFFMCLLFKHVRPGTHKEFFQAPPLKGCTFSVDFFPPFFQN